MKILIISILILLISNCNQKSIKKSKCYELWPNYIDEINTSKLDTNNIKSNIVAYNEKIDNDPRNSVLYNNRGGRYKFLEIYDSAIIDFSKAVSLDPSSGLYLYNRASCYKNTNQLNLSVNDINSAIEPKFRYRKIGNM